MAACVVISAVGAMPARAVSFFQIFLIYPMAACVSISAAGAMPAVHVSFFLIALIPPVAACIVISAVGAMDEGEGLADVRRGKDGGIAGGLAKGFAGRTRGKDSRERAAGDSGRDSTGCNE